MITHLHGDHIFGLAGVLQLISDQRAAAEAAAAKSAGAAAVPSKPLIIVGPPGLHMLLETLLLGTGLRLSMPIIGAQYVLDPSQVSPSPCTITFCSALVRNLLDFGNSHKPRIAAHHEAWKHHQSTPGHWPAPLHAHHRRSIRPGPLPGEPLAQHHEAWKHYQSTSTEHANVAQNFI